MAFVAVRRELFRVDWANAYIYDGWALAFCLLLWIWRWTLARPACSRDLRILAALLFCSHPEILVATLHLIRKIAFVSLEYHIIVLGLLGVAVFLLFESNKEKLKHPVNAAQKDVLSHTWLKPLIFPCRTSHTRLFPRKHSFSYSYLLVGIPIGWQGSVASIVSADVLRSATVEPRPKQTKAWLNVEAADYLDRGGAQLGLKGKLDTYLESQGEYKEEYSYAYLVTAPRFLGYSFNPVSFWYLYSKDRTLKAMILEVNNTFDERRIYFLKGDAAICGAALHAKQEKLINGQDDVSSISLQGSAKSKLFRGHWAKDFHVSPFNSRKGSYSLAAYDPFSGRSAQQATIDNTITLSSSKSHSKLVARIFSTGQSIDPSRMSLLSKVRFFASWWWVGFITYPRIVKEAGKLFFRKKLHVWFRPEVLKDSIGRTETDRERIIEECFRKFLKARVLSSPFSVPLEYVAAGTHCLREETFYPISVAGKPEPHMKEKDVQQKTIKFKVLTPLFYDRLPRYAHLEEFLSTEMLQQDEEQRTFWTSDPVRLLQIITGSEPHMPERSATVTRSALHRARWAFLKFLRQFGSMQRPATLPKKCPRYITTDIRRFSISTLDQYVLDYEAESRAKDYVRVVTVLLVSDYIAFGIPELMDMYDFCIRVILCYVFVHVSSSWYDTLSSASLYHSVAGNFFCCNLLHMWWLIKSWI